MASYSLLVTVAPDWLIKKLTEDYSEQLRDKGKLVIMDVDRTDIQKVDMEGDGFDIMVKVSPK